jgi:hypothetical protein
MPTINDVDVDFDAMTNEELQKYLDDLREVTAKRRPRAGASAKPPKDPSAPKAPRGRKPANVIRIDL